MKRLAGRGGTALLALTVLIGAGDGRPPIVRLHARSDDLVTAVSVRIDGHPLWFDLDTGATHSIIDASTAKRIGLSVFGNGRLRGAGTGTVAAARLKRFGVRLGPSTFTPQDPIAVDLSHVGSVIDERGLLGFDFFRHYVVDVNADNERVTLYAPERYRYGGKGALIPLVLKPPRAYVSVIVAAKGVAPERHLLRLDTGSSDAVDDDIVLRSSAPKTSIIGGVGIGGRFTTYLGNVTEVRIGPYALHDLPSATGGVQLIGDNVWRRFNIVFDFSRSAMYLERRREAGH